VPHVRDGLIVANVGLFSKKRTAFLTGAEKQDHLPQETHPNMNLLQISSLGTCAQHHLTSESR
jgi:hypothetical protein